MSKIAIIIGSTRPVRIGPQIANWFVGVVPKADGLSFDIVDISDCQLPLLDEPGIPAIGDYQNEHTKAWSAKIVSYDAFVFITPQYNWGYPAALKNALDYLYQEWTGKPAIIVSYGFHGGEKAADQLRQVLNGLKMRPMDTMPAITITKEMHDSDGQLVNVAENLQPFSESVLKAVDELVAALA